MKTMKSDPIIDELRAVRDQHAARCGYDVDAIFRDIRGRENASGQDYVCRPPRHVGTARRVEYSPIHDLPVPDTTRQSLEGQGTTATNQEKGTFGHYIVGVFDVLGQSEKLLNQHEVPPSGDEVAQHRMMANLKETMGVVIAYRMLFRKFFTGATQQSPWVDSLPGAQQEELLAATESRIVLWGVSDTIFVGVPLETSTRHPAARIADVFRSLLAAGSMWLAGLSTNQPIRGGIEIGTGMDIGPNEIYGQALAAANHLESKIAGYPRIVVGPGCVEFLKAVKQGEESSELRAKMAAGQADLCLSMLCMDADGHTMVDGLGQAMVNQRRKVPGFHDQVSRAYDVVCARCHDFRNTGPAELAARYEHLLGYFNERAPNWRTPKEDT